jgi:ubiquinone/menaquinone biosynthesis C-methylase UbiE
MTQENQSDPQRITIATYNNIAPGYCAKTRQEKYLKWEREYIRKMLEYVAAPSPLVLDVGCGDGRHCKMIDDLGGRAVGIDLSDTMLQEAQKYHPPGDFRKMDMQYLNLDDASVDAIWSSGSIYHVSKAEVDEVFDEFQRVLKPNGVLAINFKLGHGEGLEANPKSYGGSPRYFAYYSEAEMLSILTEHGFTELESCHYPEEIFGDNLQQMWLRLSSQ